MNFLTFSTRLCTLAALAVPAPAEPVITGGIPATMHCPVAALLHVQVEAKGEGALAYQWYKTPVVPIVAEGTHAVTYQGAMTPAEFRNRQDKSPHRLDSQIYDNLALECTANGGGHYWVEVTDTADHRTAIAGPMLLVPCFLAESKRANASWSGRLQGWLLPVDAYHAEKRSKELAVQVVSAPAGGWSRPAARAGSGLPVGPAAGTKGKGTPSGARTESKGGDGSAALPDWSPELYDDLPGLVDMPEWARPW